MIRLIHITTVPMSLKVFFSGQLRYMQKHGVDCQVISSPGEALGQFAANEGTPAHSVEMARRITPLHDLAAVVRLWRIFRRFGPQIVHAHTPKGGLLGILAAFLARTPVRIYHIRGFPFMTARGPKRLLLRWTERISCRLAHTVLCVSRSLREVAVAERICPADKVKVLGLGSGNGVDGQGRFNPARWPADHREAIRSQLKIPTDAVVVGFVGRVVRDKGILELLAACRALRKEFPTLHLLLVGPFEPEYPLPPEVEVALRTKPWIHLTGMVPDTSRYYPAMDVFALPSYREGFPNTPMEAAAMELPVVATRIPGCVDAVQDGVTGTLVEPRSAESLTESLRAYLLRAELRRQHGRAGRQRTLDEFRPEGTWELVRQEYLRLLRERGLADDEIPSQEAPSQEQPDRRRAA